MLSSGELHGAYTQLGLLRVIKEPIKQIKRMVDFATKKFAWGLDALGALVGIEGKRALGVQLAQTNVNNGGLICEMKELLDTIKKLTGLEQTKPKTDEELIKTKKEAASELADVITMVMAWGKRLGITDDNLDEALKTSCNKYCDRFKNILEFVKRKYINLKDIAGEASDEQLKKNGKLFNALWCAVKKKEKELHDNPALFDTLWQAYDQHKENCLQNPSAFFEKLWLAIEKKGIKAAEGFVPDPVLIEAPLI